MDSDPSYDDYGDGYLYNFVKGGIEIPVDGSNGDCVVHYEGKYEGYTMKVKLVNGMREGEATIFKENNVYMKLNYRNGELNGAVERMDKLGRIKMRGFLVDGKEDGLFREYCSSVLVWVGYFHSGRRYSVLRKSAHLDGYYEERSVGNGEILSIAKYDERSWNRNGYCIECDAGMIEEWMYENGVKKPVILEVDEGSEIPVMGNEGLQGKRDKPEERMDDSSKRIRLSPSLPEFSDDSLIVYDMKTDCEYGVLLREGKCYEVKQSVFEKQTVEVDLNSHEIRVLRNNEWMEYNKEEGCIDLDTNGRRWEGGVKDGKPFGYGVLFNEEGLEEYEGFMMDGRKSFYGKEYYEDIERVEYDGYYYDGKRFGKGVLYNRNGVIQYDGLWMDDKHYSLEPSKRAVSNHSQVLKVEDRSFDDMISFRLPSWLHSLKRIVIGCNSYYKARLFEVNGLNELKNIEVGDDSYTNRASDWIDTDNRMFGAVCRVMNCPKLESINFKRDTFRCYHACVLENLPSLQSIRMDDSCFCRILSFSLNGIYSSMTHMCRSSSTSINQIG